MGRYRTENGIDIPFTPAEEASFDAMKIAYDLAKPMNDWKTSMQETDNGMPRHMEDLITSNASLVVPAEMKKRYDDKIKIRGERP